MAEYCTEDDLVLIRPDVLDLGVASWLDQITEAGKVIDRAIEVQWYRRIAEENNIDWRTTTFDRDLLLNADSQLTRLGCYKSLEYIYLYSRKHRKDDAFEEERLLFRDMYSDELKEVLLAGIDYDWDSSGALETTETSIQQVRRLVRV